MTRAHESLVLLGCESKQSDFTAHTLHTSILPGAANPGKWLLSFLYSSWYRFYRPKLVGKWSTTKLPVCKKNGERLS